MTKSKPKPVKPVLAWCAVRQHDTELNSEWLSNTRRMAQWCADQVFHSGRVIRVEIRPAPKRKSRRTKP